VVLGPEPGHRVGFTASEVSPGTAAQHTCANMLQVGFCSHALPSLHATWLAPTPTASLTSHFMHLGFGPKGRDIWPWFGPAPPVPKALWAGFFFRFRLWLPLAPAMPQKDAWVPRPGPRQFGFGTRVWVQPSQTWLLLGSIAFPLGPTLPDRVICLTCTCRLSCHSY